MEKIHVSNFSGQYLSNLGIEKSQEAHIRLIADSVGEQVGQLATDLLAEVMARAIMGKSEHFEKHLASNQYSEILLTGSEVA
jgi:hypothetical protein